MSLTENFYINFISGTIPNFAVVFLAFGIGMIYYPILTKEIFLPLKKYYHYLLIILIWFLLLISEHIHQLFLNSPWDIFDIIASGLATLIIIIFYNFSIKN